jgi:hypothetical protein
MSISAPNAISADEDIILNISTRLVMVIVTAEDMDDCKSFAVPMQGLA